MDDLDAAADQAELTGQIRSFMAWLGEGRKLTQTGRIGLADRCVQRCITLLRTLARGSPLMPNDGKGNRRVGRGT